MENHPATSVVLIMLKQQRVFSNHLWQALLCLVITVLLGRLEQNRLAYHHWSFNLTCWAFDLQQPTNRTCQPPPTTFYFVTPVWIGFHVNNNKKVHLIWPSPVNSFLTSWWVEYSKFPLTQKAPLTSWTTSNSRGYFVTNPKRVVLYFEIRY